jgi:hypothetical protein
MIESIYAWAFLSRTLRADSELVTALGGDWVYRTRAPQGKTYPFIVGDLIASTDILSPAKVRLYVTQLWQVRLVVKGALTDAIRAAAHRLDDVLSVTERASFAAEDGTRLSFNCWRVRPFSRFEEDISGGESYCHIGGFYRLQVFK